MSDLVLRRIDQLVPFADASNEHLVAAMLDGVGGFLTLAQINALLVDGAPMALDTLAKIAAAIGSNPDYHTEVNAALSKRVRFDAAQELTIPERQQAQENMGLRALSADFVQGLRISNNSSDPTNSIDIAAGATKRGALSVVNETVMTKRLNAAWAPGTGNGGLDVDTKAPGATYHMHSLVNDATGDFDCLFSLSATAPTVSAGWSRVRRLGPVVVDGSGNIRPFVQSGGQNTRKYIWSGGGIADVNVTNPGISAVTRTLTVPTGISVEAIIGVAGGTNSGVTSANQPRGILITPLSMPDNAASSTNFSTYVFVFSSGDTQNLQLGNTVLCMTNTSGQVRSRIEQSAASTVLRMNTIGFIDEIGV